MSNLTTFFFTLLSLFALTLASPARLESSDVFTPPILYPRAGTVWIIGNTYTVTWDTSRAPVNITNKIGRVVLAKGGLEIDPQNPLAAGFNILDRYVNIQVPKVQAGNDYSIVLFGDSGNLSQNFIIKAA